MNQAWWAELQAILAMKDEEELIERLMDLFSDRLKEEGSSGEEFIHSSLETVDDLAFGLILTALMDLVQEYLNDRNIDQARRVAHLMGSTGEAASAYISIAIDHAVPNQEDFQQARNICAELEAIGAYEECALILEELMDTADEARDTEEMRRFAGLIESHSAAAAADAYITLALRLEEPEQEIVKACEQINALLPEDQDRLFGFLMTILRRLAPGKASMIKKVALTIKDPGWRMKIRRLAGSISQKTIN